MNLREKRNQILGEMRAMLDASEANGLSLEDQEVYAAKESEVERLTADIEARDRATQLEERLEKPQATPAGVLKATSVKVYEDEERAYNGAFGRYLRGGIHGLSERDRDILEKRTQNVGSPGDGGYLVPSTLLNKMVEVQKDFGGVYNYAQVINTAGGNPISYPTLNDTANQGAITAESAAFVDGADLAFGSVNLGAYKYTSTGEGTTTPLRVSVELLQDSAFDLESLIARKLGERIARKEAYDFINGTGSGEPQGLLQGSADINVDVADTLDYDDLLDLEGHLDPAYEANASWLMSKGTWNVIRGITVDGRPLVQAASVAGIGTKPEYLLLGYPVHIDQAIKTFGAATGPSTNIALGDWSEAFIIRKVGALHVVVNPYSRANYGEVEFTAWERADSAIQNRSAFVSMANL